MVDDESTDGRDGKALHEIFVSVTSESVITDRQHQDTDKKVVDLAAPDAPPGDQRFGADAAAGIDEGIGSRGPE